jgi:hypothetical protein
MRSAAAFAAPLAAALLAAWPAAAAYIYTPGAAYETAEGNDARLIALRGSDNHTQMFFDSSIFGPDPLWIDAVSFRWDINVYDDVPNFTQSFGSGFKLQMATSNHARSSTFANNLTDPVTVKSGAFSMAMSIPAPHGQMKPFNITFGFDTPYLYDPAKGRLVMDLFIPSSNYMLVDFVKNNALENWVLAQNAGTTGILDSAGPVARFEVTRAVPEPAAWTMMILGFGAAGSMLRARRRHLTAA